MICGSVAVILQDKGGNTIFRLRFAMAKPNCITHLTIELGIFRKRGGFNFFIRLLFFTSLCPFSMFCLKLRDPFIKISDFLLVLPQVIIQSRDLLTIGNNGKDSACDKQQEQNGATDNGGNMSTTDFGTDFLNIRISFLRVGSGSLAGYAGIHSAQAKQRKDATEGIYVCTNIRMAVGR